MRIVVTGRQGQVVSSLVERASGRTDVTIVAIGRPELDLARPETVRSAILASEPDVVISAAAYTAVDQAEDEPELAALINVTGADAVAVAAAEVGVPVVHLSTDYVFAGDLDRPYREDDAVAPRSAYGRTKLGGERAVADANPHHVILRTAWVYSPFGKNFLKTMLRLAAERDSLSVVADQYGNPTSAYDIADAILAMAQSLMDRDARKLFGTYHFAGAGSTHWAGFAEHIFETSRALGGPSARVKAIATADYPTKAVRPANSRLSSERFCRTFNWQPRDWRQSSQAVVRRMLKNTG